MPIGSGDSWAANQVRNVEVDAWVKSLSQTLRMAEQKLVTLKIRFSVEASRITQSSHVGRLPLNSPSAKTTPIFSFHVSATRKCFASRAATAQPFIAGASP